MSAVAGVEVATAVAGGTCSFARTVGGFAADELLSRPSLEVLFLWRLVPWLSKPQQDSPLPPSEAWPMAPRAPECRAKDKSRLRYSVQGMKPSTRTTRAQHIRMR